MNQVTLLGRIAKDLEVKAAGSTSVLSFNVAVNRKFVKDGEERQTDFIQCKAFGKTADNIAKYFQKGSMIAIEGHIQTGSYDNKEGKKVYTTDVIVESFHFTGGAKKQDATQEASFELLQAEGESALPF